MPPQSPRPSIVVAMKNSPAWAAIFVTLLLAALVAGAQGLRTATATEAKVQGHDKRLENIEGDVRYIRVRIDGFMDRASK